MKPRTRALAIFFIALFALSHGQLADREAEYDQVQAAANDPNNGLPSNVQESDSGLPYSESAEQQEQQNADEAQADQAQLADDSAQNQDVPEPAEGEQNPQSSDDQQIENDSIQMPQEQTAEPSRGLRSAAYNPPRFAQRRRRGIGSFLKKAAGTVWNGVKAVGKAALGVGKAALGVGGALLGGAASMLAGGAQMPSQISSSDIEDCVACRFIWLQVELDVGNEQIEETIYDSFTAACIEAQKAPIFYPACEDMFDDIYGMIGDYMDGYTVNQICEGARMCR